ncbi:CoB--CoM heterodisulfide reductase subunit C, partial [Methanobrevibacter gottschalkii]|uniref:CoB--CoM heterodisulfide reductase subunit C n=5 Tax=Methanobrevibacter TaxID=2172 RepID=UPI0026EE4C53
EEEVAEEVEEVEDEETTVEDVVEEVEENSNKNIKRDTMTLLTDKELLNDSNRDPDFTAEFIDAGIETVKHCFQCGTCSGGCPSGRRTPYKVRQIVRKCLLGLKEEVITDDALWMCTTCYTCQERCLRSVKIVEIIKKARNVAAHAGYMAKAHKMTGVFVLNTGHAVPINDEVKALRAKIGLPEVPPTTHAFPEALTEVQKLCKITAFDELIGYDEATGGLKE